MIQESGFRLGCISAYSPNLRRVRIGAISRSNDPEFVDNPFIDHVTQTKVMPGLVFDTEPLSVGRVE